MTKPELAAARDEMGKAFAGNRSIVGIAESDGADLTVFLADDDIAAQEAVRRWAAFRQLEVTFLLSGRFSAGATP